MAKDPSRTEQATPKRLNKARGEGNVAKSQEVSKTMSVFGGFVILTFWLSYMSAELQELFRHFLGQAHTYVEALNEVTVAELGVRLALILAKMILPVLLFILILIVVVMRLQVGKLWTTKVFKPKLSKFNPINGVKRMLFSMGTLVRLGKSLALALCIGAAPLLVLKRELPALPDLYFLDAAGIAAYMVGIGATMVKYALVPMLIIAIIDFVYTRWKYNEDLKMTKAEVKDERKQADGDPAIKNKQKQKMMQVMAQRMMQQVPKADVVITNPTHLAVALRYDATEAPAPMVVAKGADRVAERIKDIARENRVPIRENKPLARALYKQTQVGDMIPPELFQAVAVILAQIWKTKHPGRTLKP